MGPLDVALAAKNIDTNGRLVIIGDAEFANDNNYPSMGMVLLINSIDWAAGRKTSST
jgi:hypothetical protein